MDHSEPKMTEKESLELIASMIEKAKGRFTENGDLYLLWGWLILFCCIVQFIGVYFFNYPYVFVVWFSTWFMLIYQIFYLRKKRKKQTVKTYTREINNYVWIVFFICMMLVFFIELHFNRTEIINPLLLVLYGMPTFLSGIILKFKPLIIGAICCWLLSVLSVFVPFEYQVLFLALAIVSAWIIPGYILKREFKRVN